MLDAFEVFRIRFGGRPVLMCLAVFALLVLIRRASARQITSHRWTTWAVSIVAVAALAALVAYPAVAIWYGSDPHFFDNAEPVIPAVGWLFHVGRPVYHGLESAERYAHIYGPFAFITHGWALGLFGPSILVSKGLGVAGALASLVLVHLLVRRHIRRTTAFVLTGICALLLLLFRHYSFWTRPEPLQLLAVSAALVFATARSRYLTTIASGAAIGVLWNLKITGAMYTLPVFALLERRGGWRHCLVALVAALAMASFPFAYYGNVSLSDYLIWLRLSGSTGLLLSTLRQNIEWAIYLCLPIVLSYYAVPRALRPESVVWRNTLAALVVGVTGVVIAASKPGAGPYHLIPFLPIIVYIVAWHLARFSPHVVLDVDTASAAVTFVLTAVLIGTAQQLQFVTTMRDRRLLHESDDIRGFSESHQGTVAMGYGATESLSLERPLLVFRSNSYLLDQPAIREHQLQGIEVPRATIQAIADCRVNYWLIPKGEAPFSARNSYAAVLLRSLYPEEFRRVFEQAHSIVGSTTYYDIWQCHGAPFR
jgi:hypothetical protein